MRNKYSRSGKVLRGLSY